MELIIDIPNSIYANLPKIVNGSIASKRILDCVKNGTPLPKGHGRLIDADALNIRMEQRMNEIGDDESIWESSNVATALDMFAPTIVEADREGKDASID